MPSTFSEHILGIVLVVPPALFSITVHEAAHGFVAYMLGDNTPKVAGRLSLNPLKHIDPFGLLALIVTRVFGWAKPVPINPYNFNNFKLGIFLVAISGPISNFLLAVLLSQVLRLAIKIEPNLLVDIYSFMVGEGVFVKSFSGKILLPIVLMLFIAVVVNFALGIFNLLPILPLDGGRVLWAILPKELAEKYEKIEPLGIIIVVVLVFYFGLSRYVGMLVWKLVLLSLGV